MSKAAYATVGGVYHKIKKGYGIVDGVSRKIKKAYSIIGGVARPCWAGGEVTYYGQIAAITNGRSDLAAASVGNYALFASGLEQNWCPKYVDAYNASLTCSRAPDMNTGRYCMAAASVGDYAIFDAGINSSGDIEVYNSSLTHSLPSVTKLYRGRHAGATINNVAIFAGGTTDVVSFNASLTRTVGSTGLSQARKRLAATTVGNYAVFGGGAYDAYDYDYEEWYEQPCSTVEAYNSSLTRTVCTNLSVIRQDLAGATTGNYAIFGGGTGGYAGGKRTADAYNESLTRVSLSDMNSDYAGCPAASLDGNAIFKTGVQSLTYEVSWFNSYVTVYDSSLTRKELSGGKGGRGAATTIGNYALFGGGYYWDDYYGETSWQTEVFTIV